MSRRDITQPQVFSCWTAAASRFSAWEWTEKGVFLLSEISPSGQTERIVADCTSNAALLAAIRLLRCP